MELGASLRVRESLGETEGLGPVNSKHEDVGKCMTIICTGSALDLFPAHMESDLMALVMHSTWIGLWPC